MVNFTKTKGKFYEFELEIHTKDIVEHSTEPSKVLGNTLNIIIRLTRFREAS